MVILIGGVSCTGKTVMAQKLLEKYKIPCLRKGVFKTGSVFSRLIQIMIKK